MSIKTFQSSTSVFLTYLIFKASPVVALVYYFFNWPLALLSAVLFLASILIYSGKNNHHFTVDSERLIIHQSLFFWIKDAGISYKEIKSIEIKYANEKDNRQWLLIDALGKKKYIYRCDWIHTQDPPEDEDDHHQLPEGELFELLENEDFYKGSLNELADVLREKKLDVKEFL